MSKGKRQRMQSNFRRRERREEAVARQEEYDKLSLPQRVAKLDVLLGKGVGAKKVRAKLAKQMETVEKGA